MGPISDNSRDHLVRALEADVVGPFRVDDSPAPEKLPLPPSRWYVAGFLAPAADREQDDPAADDDGTAGSVLRP